MKHPSSEQCVAYVFGDASPEVYAQVSEHQAICPACRTEIEAWKRSVKRLDAWKLPEPTKRAIVAQPVAKWAIAALLMLGLGFGLGRLATPANSGTKLIRAEMQSLIESAVATELHNAVALAETHSSNAVASMETRLAKASEAETRRMLRDFIEVFNTARQEDRRETLSLLERIQREHAAAYVALRRDLETVASLTDEEIRLAHLKLMQFSGDLASNQRN
jgi:hypothetical protein